MEGERHRRETSARPHDSCHDWPNINCLMVDQSEGRSVRCQSLTPGRLIEMDARGRLTVCRNSGPGDNHFEVGDRGDGPIRPLAYGKHPLTDSRRL